MMNIHRFTWKFTGKTTGRGGGIHYNKKEYNKETIILMTSINPSKNNPLNTLT